MTIYECLGIEEFLIDETIPTDLIIENIDRADLRYDASVFFKDITRVSIRASLNRGNHFMQVIEVELNNVDHISEISVLIQKAIRYQVLFVFNYEERYLILRRSFNLTMSTEHVYTEHASFSTDWIYAENLEDDLVALFDTNEIINYYDEDFELPFEPKKTDSDNGDHRYFDDVIGNAIRLNRSIIESDVVSLRFLLDWWNLHIAGSRVNIYEVLDRVREVQAYQMIGDHLFVEKGCVRYAISEFEHSEYTVSLDHTGKNPMFYFRNSSELATYAEADKLMVHLLYGSERDDEFDAANITDELPADIKRYVGSVQSGGIIPNTTQATPRLGFIDEIIRRHQLRGYHLLEDQPLRYTLVRRLRVNGYQMLEQFRTKSIQDIGFLSPVMQMELLLCMDRVGIRFEECSKTEFPDILDFIKENFVCGACGAPIDNTNIARNKCFCTSCQTRLDHLEKEKAFCVTKNTLAWGEDDNTTTLDVVFALDENEVFELASHLELKDGYIMLNDSTLYRCDSADFAVTTDEGDDSFFTEQTSLRVVWSSDDYDFSADNAEFIHLVFKNKSTEKYYLFVFKFDEDDIKLYDYIAYLDYTAYKAERAKQELGILVSIIEDNLDERISVETCLENIALPEIQELYKKYYLTENGLYYNRDKTTLVMCDGNNVIESVDLPNTVKVIGRSAFRGVNEIGHITFPDDLDEISAYAFLGVAFKTDVVLPNSITQIGRRAFFRSTTPTDSINIPANLENVDRFAFPTYWSLRCSEPGENLSQGVKTILSTTRNKVLFGDEQQPVIIEQGSSWDFSWELNSANELFITASGDFSPHRWDSDKDTEWRKYARRIKKLIFSSGITSVAGSAFAGCDNISEVAFPETLVHLDVFTLKHTEWYKNLEEPLSTVGDSCLIKVLTDDYILKVPDNIKYVSRITDSSFSENKRCPNVRHIVLGANVQQLLPFAFDGSEIETVSFNDGLLEIGQQSLSSCSNLRFLCLPNSVRNIGCWAFSHSRRLECVVLSEKLESIDSNAFDGCYWLEKIIVPFDKDEFSKKVSKTFGRDSFPYDKCVFSTTVDDRKITKQYEMITRKRTKWESRPVTLSNHPAIKEPLARTLRKYGLHTIEDLRKWGAKEIWEYIYNRERYPKITFNSLVKLVLAYEDIPEITEDKLIELYDFADSVVGYKLERKLLSNYKNEAVSPELVEKYPHAKHSIQINSTNLVMLPNIGVGLQDRLRAIGIKTVPELLQMETEEIWDKLFVQNSSTHYFEIYSIEGARYGKKVEELDPKRKEVLRAYVDKKKGKLAPDPEELTSLPNIGKTLGERLYSIGITSASQLDAQSTESIWDALYKEYPKVDAFEIYSIEGAKLRVKLGNLSGSRRDELKQYVKSQKASIQQANAVSEQEAEETRRLEEERLKAEAEALRIAEEHRRAEEERIAEEKKKAEAMRKLEEERLKAEAAIRLLEEQRKAEEARKREEARLKAEAEALRIAEAARLAEEKRKAQEALRLEEERQRLLRQIQLQKLHFVLSAVYLRQEENEKRLAAEAARKAAYKKAYLIQLVDVLSQVADNMLKRAEEEAKRIAEEKRLAEETRLAEERRRAEELRKVEEERIRAEAEAKRLAEESRRAEELRLAEEKRRAEEAQRLEAERVLAEKRMSNFRNQKVCQHCGGKFKGLFSKRCSVCGKPKDY